LAAPSFHSPLAKAVKAVRADAENEEQQYRWMLPSIIQAGLIERGASIFVGDTYAGFEGRSLEIKQEQLSVGVTDSVLLFYGRHFDLAKGISSTSRFNDSDDYYGARVVIKRPTPSNPAALSLQLEAIRPGQANLVTSGTAATFDATSNNVFSLNAKDSKENIYQLQYTDVSAPFGRNAHVGSIAYARDYELGEFFKARVQGTLIGETYQPLGQSAGSDVKPMFYGAIAVTPLPWLAIELDATILPSGIPFAGGEYTGLSSFGIYEPGGVFTDLRHDPVAFGSARIVIHGKF